MEIKGELKRNGLPALFRNFATENFHGVLTVTSSVGEKLITLTENEVTIYCDETNESSRLGNILQGRNLVTEENLEDALSDQRKLEPRPKLGDLLVQRGIVSEKIISDARNFQIEEDICDILSWKNATFHFAGQDSTREIHPEDFAPDQVHRLIIDPDTFFKFVTKVTEDWDVIGDRLPTQYLCFKLSAKVEESISSLSTDAQRVLRFLKEGRTIEGAVKQSCIGRVQVCVHVINLLEKGLILPASGADLRFLASEHRAQKRYHDAIYIYRRLLESPDSKEETTYLQNLIEEISEQILRMKQSGDYGEEAIIVSHRDAKDRYIKKQSRKNILLGIGVGAVIAVLCYFFIQKVQPNEQLTLQYKETITRVDTLLATGKFNEAVKELDSYYDKLSDKESPAAIGIQAKKERIPAQLHNHIENRVRALEEQCQLGGEDRAKAVEELRELNEEFPQNFSENRIKELIQKYEVKKIAAPKNIPPPVPAVPEDELMKRLAKADDLKTHEKYVDARREYLSITQLAPASTEVWKLSNAGAKFIEEIEISARKILDEVVVARDARQGEKAIELADRALKMIGDLADRPRAEADLTYLLARKEAALQAFKSAKSDEDANRIFEARTRYEQVAVSYPEFLIAVDARKKSDELKIQCDVLLNNLAAALEEVKNFIKDMKSAESNRHLQKAREIYKPLLQFNQQLLIEMHVDLPVNVTSIPSGSRLKLNGKFVGTTPTDVFIPAGTAFELVVERPGFTSKKYASDRVKLENLNAISIKLDLEPIVLDFNSGPLQTPTPLLAPPVMFENRLIVLNGPDMVGIDPATNQIIWTLPGLYDTRAALPEGAPIDNKNFWNFVLPPMPYKPGFMLLPTRSRDLLEINLSKPELPTKRSMLGLLNMPLPEIVGSMFIDVKSILAGQTILIAPFADGQIRCFTGFELDEKSFSNPKWVLPLDPQDATRREKPAAGLFGHKGEVWALSGGGTLQAFNPIVENKPVFRQEFSPMSPRSTFASFSDGTPTGRVGLGGLVQRNGKVILFDLDNRKEIWSLAPKAAMDESVGASIDESGVYITSRKDNNDELLKYPHRAAVGGGAPPPDWTVRLDGTVTLEMAIGKHLYLVTQFKVLAYSKKDRSLIWEYRLKPEQGEPKSIRVIGDYVCVLTDKGKLILLKSE